MSRTVRPDVEIKSNQNVPKVTQNVFRNTPNQSSYVWALTVAQLAERSLLAREIHRLNPDPSSLHHLSTPLSISRRQKLRKFS